MNIEIRPLAEADLPAADRIFRLAFGTFIGLPDPMTFMGDADLIATRWRADPGAALGAYRDDVLIGSNFLANWGGFGFFGPLTIHPDYWDKGIARRLLDATMARFAVWGTRQLGLFTFPDSPKHIALYQKYGFARQALTPVLAKPVGSVATLPWTTYGAIPARARAACLAAGAALTDAVCPGLDLQAEIQAADRLKLGDTVLIHEDTDLIGLAVCHMGPGTEAGGGTAYVKFGAVLPGEAAPARLDRLLAACEALAESRGLNTLVAGTNAARTGALAVIEARGFEPIIGGVAMQRPDNAGFNRPDCFVVDDWR